MSENKEQSVTMNDLFYQAVVALVSWKDPTPHVEKALELQPNHFYTLVFKLLLDVLGTGVVLTSESITNQVKQVNELYKTLIEEQGNNGRAFNDLLAVFMKAVLQFSSGQMKLATETMEDFISRSVLSGCRSDNVDDKKHSEEDDQLERALALLALKLNHDSYFYLGQSNDIYQSVERVIDHLEGIYGKSIYGYALGMYAFGLEESYQFRKAEEVARKALEINSDDAWAVHAATHVMEMEGRQSEGIDFLSKTELNWSVSGPLACHLYWHWCLHLIELDRFSEAIHFFDKEIEKRCQSGAMLDLVDGSSLLFRISFEHKEMVDGRWEAIQQLWLPHIHDHVMAFNDAHIAMSFPDKTSVISDFLSSLEKYASSGPEQQINHEIVTTVGINVVKAVIAYNESKFETTVELLAPAIQEKTLIHIGGSHAQRDVFQLLLINACLRSGKLDLAKELLAERKAAKPNSGQTDRLLLKLQEQS